MTDHSEDPRRVNAKSEFATLVERYLKDFHSRHPTLASFSGVHNWDLSLEDFSPSAREEEANAASSLARDLEATEARDLDLADRLDRQLLLDNAKARLHELERVRFWQKSPQLYGETLASSLLYLALFEHGSETERIRIATAKLRRVPGLIESARRNIENPAPILVKTGARSLAGALRLVEKDLPKVFAGFKRGQPHDDYLDATAEAASELRGYLEYLESELAPRASGKLALGRDDFEKKLRYEEGVTLSIEELLEIGQSALEDTKGLFCKAAARIDPKTEPVAVWQRLKHDHPPAGRLVREAQAQLHALARFIEERKIVSIPAACGVQVDVTPEIFRWSFASLWPPGAFEDRAFPARYFITEVDPRWSEEQKEQHLTCFAYSVMWSISIHEAYPGHAVQFAHLKRVDSPARKVLGIAPNTYVEGWAHYAEEMMIEEGFGDGNPSIRLGQLRESLIRLCRYMVAIKMHTEDMTLEEATQFFIENAHSERLPAEKEAERGAFDPTYLSYALGKLHIEKLREDCKRAQGPRFSLREFHNTFLGLGMAPLWLHRRVMLSSQNGDADGTLPGDLRG